MEYDGEHQPLGPQSASTRQLPGTQWLPAPPVYCDPWHAHTSSFAHALSSAQVSIVQKQYNAPPLLWMQRPFTPASEHCVSSLHVF